MIALAVGAAATLNEVLAALGMSTRPSPFPGTKTIIDADGTEIGDFTASACWRWLRDEGRITKED